MTAYGHSASSGLECELFTAFDLQSILELFRQDGLGRATTWSIPPLRAYIIMLGRLEFAVEVQNWDTRITWQWSLVSDNAP